MHEYKFNFGCALYLVAQFEDALALFTEAIECCPATKIPAKYYIYRAQCNSLLGNSEEATADRVKASRIDRTINVYPLHIRLLPDDTIIIIMSYLDLSSLRNCAMLCRQMHGTIEKMKFSKLMFLQYDTVMKNIEKVLDSDQFLELDYDDMKYFVKRICVKDKTAKNNRDLFVQRWISADTNGRILKCINDGLIDASYRKQDPRYQVNSQILEWVKERNLILNTLLYDAKTDGFLTKNFHEKVCVDL
jgi:tetratricopeptide (TPR) repeat protein